MDIRAVPAVFLQLQSYDCIRMADLRHTQDGFWVVCRSLSEILAQKGILDLLRDDGERLACDRFFDDWFLYALPNGSDYVYSLLKLREQEHDAACDSPADGDMPGVTISFVPFSCEALLNCLAVPSDENRQRLEGEIDRTVARKGQRHHKDLKRYFADPRSEGAYLVADLYVRHIASFAEHGTLDVPEHYGRISRNRRSRLPSFIESLNQAAGRVVCDHEKVYIQNVQDLTEHESAALLATHTGNTSRYSFAAEVEFHARFLIPLAKIKIPFLNRSAYESAIRADMSIGDATGAGFAPFYREGSKMIKRQYRLHKKSNGGKK